MLSLTLYSFVKNNRVILDWVVYSVYVDRHALIVFHNCSHS